MQPIPNRSFFIGQIAFRFPRKKTFRLLFGFLLNSMAATHPPFVFMENGLQATDYFRPSQTRLVDLAPNSEVEKFR